MRILLFISSMDPRNGGPPQVVAGSALALAASGARVTILTVARKDAQSAIVAKWPALAAAGVEMVFAEPSGPQPLLRSRAAANYVRHNRSAFDIVHIHAVWEGAAVQIARVAQRFAIPYVISTHGTLDPWSMRQSTLKKRASLTLLGTRTMIDNAAALIFGTTSERDAAAVLGFAAPTACIANGIHTQSISTSTRNNGAALKAQFPAMAAWDRTLIFYARLHPKKGLDLLLEAFALVATQFPTTGVMAAAIPDDPVYEASLRARCTALGLDDRFIVTTAITGAEGRAALRNADIFVLPSHQEGFSMAIIEAMAMALPIVITDKCHMPMVEDWQAGAVCEDTVPSLATALQRMLVLDDAALTAMGTRAREAAVQHYDWSVIALSLTALYSRILS